MLITTAVLPNMPKGDSIVWLHIKEWTEARKDLNTARIKGRDIIEAFQDDYANVEGFEQKHNVKLPADIAALLTPS